MNADKKKLLIVYIKDLEKITYQADQTKNIRNDTNKRIKELGNKFYAMKNLFEKMNLKRDDLFYFGKQLVDEYKGIKNGIHLQNQKKRMKDALICWYCENFFDDIFKNNSLLLQRLFELSKNPFPVSIFKKKTEMSKTQKKSVTKNKNVLVEQIRIAEKENSDPVGDDNMKDQDYITLGGLKISQEIDTFEYPGISNLHSNQNDEISGNNNFDFMKMLQF